MDTPPPYVPRPQIRAQDFETASIRSAAPSYTSAAPSYSSLLPPSSSSRSRPSAGLPSPYATPSSLCSSPRMPSVPSLHLFRTSTTLSSTSLSHPNPKARHYHSVALRRASKQTIQEQSTLLLSALSGEDGIAQMKKRMEEETLERIKRTSEDPELVGEAAAEENRRNREAGLKDVLEREDKRWDWLLAQMSDWEERDKSWKKFREEVEGGKSTKLAKRLGIGGSKRV